MKPLRSRPADSPPERPRRLWGLAVVGLLHLLLGWALVSGLARRMVEVVRAPVETRIIEEARLPEPPPPPPPPPPAPPPPTPATPTPPVAPPAFVPAPEVPVTPPPVPAPTITTTPVAPPAAEVAISPAPPVVAAPPAPPAPPVRTAPVLAFGNCKPDYPAAAFRVEAQGTVQVSFTMEPDGRISEAHVERSAGPTREHKLLDRATVEAVLACRGKPGTVDGRPERLNGIVRYTWTLDQ